MDPRRVVNPNRSFEHFPNPYNPIPQSQYPNQRPSFPYPYNPIPQYPNHRPFYQSRYLNAPFPEHLYQNSLEFSQFQNQIPPQQSFGNSQFQFHLGQEFGGQHNQPSQTYNVYHGHGRPGQFLGGYHGQLSQTYNVHRARMDAPTQAPAPMNISSGDDSPRLCPTVETVDLEGRMDAATQAPAPMNISSGDDSPRLSPTVETDPKTVDPEEALFRKAGTYQEGMNGIAVPTKRGSVILFKTWEGLGWSMKELYKQPLHYLTNIHLRRLDQMRLGAEDEDIAKLWLADPMYHMYIDPVPYQAGSSSPYVVIQQ